MDGKLCSECGKEAARLRRDRCDACYMRLYRGGDVPAGAVCAGCGERRRELLCMETLGSEDQVVCGNCALVLRRARPRLGSIAELRRRRTRERRGPAAPPPDTALTRRADDHLPAPSVPRFDIEID
jgi:hypothetical protein